ncbi:MULTISPECIES: hypothetical protein [Streptomyces]|uniref:hypothetical protein n=1 Tax=Streptomyces TaxID=1883 RepID=UPI0004A8B896|nr:MULTISPECIES: hypothetical protein [unclassified Streptomyces]KDQ65539.1 hypothetical protein DT87_32195 [Streptomyces sp. NTK 937]SCD45094.1 hypothetical protein GA0115247_10518 [Streptomyces sp. PalvLS-984]SDC29732.1 hypothetical protein F558DRAFT_01531 [Streptomyces sp. AmelKG-A3]
MTSEARRHPRIQNLTTAGTALAVALLPLAAGVLLARAAASDPLAPVNALVTGAGGRVRVAPPREVLRARTRHLLARGEGTRIGGSAAAFAARVRTVRAGERAGESGCGASGTAVRAPASRG